MKKLGEYLKSERERKKLSVHEIGVYLKISPKILSAIEEGQQDKLPAKTFLRGFVRSYAQYLKLNTEDVMKLFQEEMGSTHPPNPILKKEGASEEEKITSDEASTAPQIENKIKNKKRDPDLNEERFSSNKIVFSLVALVLVALIVTVTKLIEKYNKERETNPVAELHKISPLPQAEPPIKPIEPEPTVMIGPMPEPVSEEPAAVKPELKAELKKDANADQKLNTKQEEKKLSREAELKVTKTEKTPEKVAEKVAEKKPEPKVETKLEPKILDKPVEVIIEATQDVTLTYDLGNGKSLPLSLEKGQFHTFKSKSEIKLDVTNAGAINVFVNGASRGPAGASGTQKILQFP